MRRAFRLPAAVISVFLLAGSAVATDGAWIPESLEMWLEGLELMHTARGDDAVAWLEKKRRERPNDSVMAVLRGPSSVSHR